MVQDSAVKKFNVQVAWEPTGMDASASPKSNARKDVEEASALTHRRNVNVYLTSVSQDFTHVNHLSFDNL